MSRIDFDKLSEAITPKQFAKAIDARAGRSPEMFHCSGPAHKNGDKKASLSINRKDGRTVVYCHSCDLKGTPVQVAAELWGLSHNDAAERLAAEAGIATLDTKSSGNGLGEIIATYEYTDESGKHLYEVVRYAHPKTFRQRVKQGEGWSWKLGDTRRVLHRLPEVVAKVKKKGIVMICEGEKDADALRALGFVATCNAGGAGKWRPEYSESLQGTPVVIFPDNDQPGREHAQAVARDLHGKASEIRVLELPGLPNKGDVSDWLQNGGTKAELKRLVKACPIWDPSITVAEPEGTENEAETDSTEDVEEPDERTEYDWPEDPHLPSPPEPDALPLEALPPVLRDMARTIHEATQAPLDSAIGAVLGGVSVAIVGKLWVEICPRRQWVKPAHEYIGIQQHSGTGKSPLINMVLQPIEAWEAKRASEESGTRRWAGERIKLAEKRVESARKDAVNDEGLEDNLERASDKLAEALKEPHGEFQLLLSDATEEGLVRVLKSNGGRAASVDPEATILEVLSGRYGTGDARLGALTHGWDGEPMRTNRASRERVDLPSVTIALLLGIQPGVLKGMANAETMLQKGVLARFLWIAPTIQWDELLTGEDVPSLDQAAVTRYEEMLTRLLDKSDKSEGGPHILKMSAEAQEGVYRLEQAKVDGMRPGGPLQSVPAFAGKLPDHGARIAALLTVADRADRGEDPFCDPIPGWAMESAEQLISAISTHIVKVTGDARADPVLSDLRYLMKRVEEMEGSTESEIREKARARNNFRDAKHAKKMFDELVQCGFIRRIPQDRIEDGGRDPSPRIEINPHVRGSELSDKRGLRLPTGNKSEKSAGGEKKDEGKDGDGNGRENEAEDTNPEQAGNRLQMDMEIAEEGRDHGDTRSVEEQMRDL